MSVWVLCIHYGLVLSWLYFQKPQIGYNGHPLSIKMNETEDNYQSRPPTHLVCKVPPVRDQGVIPELLSIGSDMECLRSLGLYLQTRNCRLSRSHIEQRRQNHVFANYRRESHITGRPKTATRVLSALAFRTPRLPRFTFCATAEIET